MPISIYKKRLLCAALALFSAAFAFLPAAAEEVPSGIIGFSPKVEEPAEAEEPAGPKLPRSAGGARRRRLRRRKKPGETTAEEFDFPDTHPLSRASVCKETPEGVAYLMAEDGSHMMAVGWRGEGKTITVPETIDGLPVTEIMATAFSGTEKVENIILPDSIEIIGKFAFAQMPQPFRLSCRRNHGNTRPASKTHVRFRKSSCPKRSNPSAIRRFPAVFALDC